MSDNVASKGFRGPATLAVFRLAAMALPLLTAPLVARSLGPESRGLYGSAVAVLTLAPVGLSLGVPHGVRRLVASGRGVEGLAAAFRAAPLVLLPLVGSSLLAIQFLLDGISRGAAVAFVALMAVSTLQTLVLCMQSAMIAKGSYLALAITQTLPTVVMAVVVVALWILEAMSLQTLFAALAAGILAAFAVGYFALPKLEHEAPLSVRALLRISRPYSGNQVAEVAGNTALLAIATATIGPEQAGFFSIALTIGAVHMITAHTVGVGSYGKLARARQEEFSQHLVGTLRPAVALSLFIGVCSIPAVYFLVPMLFGAEFEGAVLPSILAIAAGGLAVLLYLLAQALSAAGRGRDASLTQVAGVVAGVGTLAVAMLVFGAPLGFGAVIAVASSIAGRVVGVAIGLARLRISAAEICPRPRDFSQGIRRAFSRGTA